MTEIQKKIIEIYKEVSKICETNNIPYYAIGGTCIGAIRHKGFIPWDDDLDIAIPIEYWDNFIKISKEKLPEHLYIYGSDSIRPYHYIWLKICDKNTTFIEKSEYNLKDAWKGIFIDIMPISGIPEKQTDISKLIKKLRNLENLNNYLRFPNANNTIRSFLGRMPFRILSKFLPFNYFSRKFIKELKKYPFKNAINTGYVWHPQWLPRLIFSKAAFGNGIIVPFEDTKIRVPENFHVYLTQQFGEYMRIPPADQREIHDGFVDATRPFSYYINKELVDHHK